MTSLAQQLRHFRFILVMTLLSVLFSSSIYAASQHQKAKQLADSGDIQGMSDTYQGILNNNPTDTKARLGLATAQSWLGNHADAQSHFEQVLNQQPENLEALIGLGYNHAWAGQFDQAEQQFKRATDIAPDNLGAQKGLGFSYLWSQQPQKALDIFQAADQQNPTDAETLTAIGQAQLALKQYSDAEVSFQLALTISPDRADALAGLEQIKSQKKGMDITAWVGDTSNGGDTGLREVIVGYWINHDVRSWFRYDNSLSLDNPALVRSGSDAETYYFGAMSQLDELWHGNIEIGFRDLPNNADQKIIKAEALQIKNEKVFKLGAQLSPHSDNYTDTLFYTAYGYPLNKRWRLEPSLYLSTSGAIDDREWRAVLFAEYFDPAKWSIGASAGIGDVTSDNASAEGSVFSSNVLFSYPINKNNRLNLSVRYEDSPLTSYTTMLVGIAIQL